VVSCAGIPVREPPNIVLVERFKYQSRLCAL
jgi:hypothetical protein